MRFVPYQEIRGAPNVIVDGAGTVGTVLTLSHWPRSGSPAAFKADTSAEMVFRYLDQPDARAAAEVVSNNHFDEDGLVGAYALVEPDEARRGRALLEDVARAGDFGTYRSRDAARIAFTISAFADAVTTPLDRALFARPYPEMAAALYQEMLPRLPDIAARIDAYRTYWQEEDARLAESEAALRDGRIRIEERAEDDLAIVRVPDDAAESAAHRFTQRRRAVCHPMAIHNATRCSRILLVRGRTYELQYRYESWVQYVSRRPAPRVDLAPLAAALTAEERSGARWEFDGVEEITPSLRLAGKEGEAVESAIAFDRFLPRLVAALREGPPAHDPYDASPPAR